MTLAAAAASSQLRSGEPGHGTRSRLDTRPAGLFDGARAGLVGPNGSDESTLLRILAGIETPDRGTRSVRGGVRVGYVARDPIFPHGGTVEDVLAAALTAVGDGDRPRRIALALGRAGFADRRAAVDTLSGGGQKRLAVASALAATPGVLLMDEPTNRFALAEVPGERSPWREKEGAEGGGVCPGHALFDGVSNQMNILPDGHPSER